MDAPVEHEWAGWYPDPDRPSAEHAQRYWDGYRWTTDTRVQVPRSRYVMMSVLTLLGGGVVALGAFVAFDTPSDTGPNSAYCQGSPMQLVSPGVWLAWCVLVLLAGAGTALWLLTSRGDARLGVPALLGCAATIVLCPLWLVFAAGANCAL